MKKSIYLLAIIAICACVCTGCENSNGKATEKTVLKYLPGTWKVTQTVDENGTKKDFTEEIVFEFGKQQDPGDFSQNNSSSIWGYCSITMNGEKIMDRGTWNIEPVAEDKGVSFYCQNGYSYIDIKGESFFMITSIGSSSMRWETTDDQSGYILTRVE